MPDTGPRPLPLLDAPNLAAAIRLHASTQPERIALVEHGPGGRRALSWAELEQLVDADARGFAARGVRAGERVLLMATNTIATAAAWFGALRAGVIAAPVSPGARADELARIVAHSGARLLVGSPPVEQPAVPVVAASDLAAPADDTIVASPRDPEAIAVLPYTSGTTGQPKAAMLSHRALIAHCESSWLRGLVDPDAVVLCCLPLFHTFGLNAVLGAGMYAGATVVLVDRLPDALPEILTGERVTHLPVTPSGLYAIGAKPEIVEASAALRQVTSGAAPLPAALAAHWRRLTGVAVHQGYGLTEAVSGVASTVGGECRGTTHVGRALPGMELRIGDGSQPGEPAEVWIRGRSLFSGYWPDGTGGPDAEGWFATGDIGYLEGDELFLVDRVGELIIVSGFNVYPTEVEAVLCEHPDVDVAAVIGRHDDRTGERVVAFVTGHDRVDAASVLAHARTRLAPYKMPVEVMVIKAMPRSVSGKIRKPLLRDMLDMTDEEDL